MKSPLILAVVLLVAACERAPDSPAYYGVGEYNAGPGLAYASSQGGSSFLADQFVPEVVEADVPEKADVGDVPSLDLGTDVPEPDPDCMAEFGASLSAGMLETFCTCKAVHKTPKDNVFCECKLLVCVDQPDEMFKETYETKCKEQFPEDCNK